MKRLAFPLLCLASAALAAEAGLQVTKRAKNEAREGPGNYYPLVSVLPKGAAVPIIKVQGGWVNFKLEPSKGKPAPNAWIAKNCLAEKEAGKSVMDMDLKGSPAGASPASVAAAVRGFAMRYGRAKESSLDALNAVKQPFFSVDDYLEFKSAMKRPPSGLSAQDPRLMSPYEATAQEEGVGLGIAARVAARGIDGDRALLRYLNMLGTYLAEASGAYDYPFKFYVMKAKEVNAVAVPGGYIFLSAPLVSACTDEAELAAVVAHEMTHVILRHGLKELKARDLELRADEADSELDAMAGRTAGEEEEGLEEWASSAYEAVHKPRLESYEEEADRGAAIILARAGYDAAALPRMIRRVGDAAVAAQTLETENPFSKMDYKKRTEAAEDFLRESLPVSGGMRNRERFERSVKLDR